MATSTSSFEPPTHQGPRSRTRDVINLVNHGGLGRAARPPSRSPSPPPAATNIDYILDMFEQQYLPHQPKSLSGIAVRSLILGISFTASLHLTLYIRFCTNSAAWRAPLFVTTLSAFHFLEFWTTATYNTSTAETQSFLFTSNGHAYYIAHTLAIAECLLRTVLFPNPHVLPAHIFHLLTFLGLVLIITMQAVRSLAMITAGQSFNHVVQHRKARTHALITTGIYSHLRHPSYFGYFWWGLGTQLMLGNAVCFIGYALVLWKFFAARIPGRGSTSGTFLRG